jgi:hypothetical protein
MEQISSYDAPSEFWRTTLESTPYPPRLLGVREVRRALLGQRKAEAVFADEGHDWGGNVKHVEEMGTTAAMPAKRIAKRLYFRLTYQVHVKFAAISAVFRHKVLQRVPVLEQTNALQEKRRAF